jgi:predicted oxidoreductase
MGLTTFDHADIYGGNTCEAIFGRALGRMSSLRAAMHIVSKCGIKLVPQHRIKSYDTSKAHIIASAENSLKALQTDYLDLLLIHRPDPLMNADEVAEAFTELWEDGKVLHFGVSNFVNHQFSLLDSRLSEFDLITNQIEFSVLHTDPLHDGALDWCQMLGLAPMIYSPLGGGRLFDPGDARGKRVYDELARVGEELGAGVDQVALAWILAHPSNPVVVLGSGKIERLAAAAESESLNLSREQWFSILKASAGDDVP